MQVPPSIINPDSLGKPCEDVLKILNYFTDFICNIKANVTDSPHFKEDAIKVINCLKFIKINLEFIGYVVENRTDSRLYRDKTDKAKGVIRDFYGTSFHVNSYCTSVDAQSALENLVLQIENAITAMRKVGKLEAFCRELQFDKDTGCIEARTAKALSFAAACLSSSSHHLDQLMEQCQFIPEDDATKMLEKSINFFKPYIGQACIWQNKDYIIDESLIRQYLTEVFGIEFPAKEIEIIKNLFEGFTLIEKAEYLKSPLTIESFEAYLFLLEEIEKMNEMEQVNLKMREKLHFFNANIGIYFCTFAFTSIILSIAIAGIAAIAIGSVFMPWLLLGLIITSGLGCIGLYFIWLMGEEPNLSIVLLIMMAAPVIGIVLAGAITGVILDFIVSVITSFGIFISNKEIFLFKKHQDFVINKNLLLTRYIDDYFEGKDNKLSVKLISLFNEYLTQKGELTEKESAFLQVINKEYIYYPEINIDEIWREGVKSWHHYRYLRQNNSPDILFVISDLLCSNRLFEGSLTALNESSIAQIRANFTIVEETILNNEALAKVIKPKDWQLFIEQLQDLNYRALLRKPVSNQISCPTYKFVHCTGEIVPYQGKRCPKEEYTHTKKTSTTLISSKKNTQLFGAHHNIPSNLVGLLFHQGKCKVKARLLKDSGTYQHAWIGNEEAVKSYSACMQAINEIDEISFKDKIQNTTRTNEVLAKLNKEALLAIVIAGRDTTEARQLGISRQCEIKNKFSIVLPIIFYDSSQKSIKPYEWEKNTLDLNERKKLNLKNLNYECLNRNWKHGFFHSAVFPSKQPKLVKFFTSKIKKLELDEENNYFSWAKVEQEIKDKLIKKCNQNKFFRILKGRSDDTTLFYQDMLNKLRS